MKFGPDGTNIDVMAHSANEQMTNSHYREEHGDIMNKYAMLQASISKFCTCPACGDFQRLKQCCDKCGARLRK